MTPNDLLRRFVGLWFVVGFVIPISFLLISYFEFVLWDIVGAELTVSMIRYSAYLLILLSVAFIFHVDWRGDMFETPTEISRDAMVELKDEPIDFMFDGSYGISEFEERLATNAYVLSFVLTIGMYVVMVQGFDTYLISKSPGILADLPLSSIRTGLESLVTAQESYHEAFLHGITAISSTSGLLTGYFWTSNTKKAGIAFLLCGILGYVGGLILF